MKKNKIFISVLLTTLLISQVRFAKSASNPVRHLNAENSSAINPALLGFSPQASGEKNTCALQEAVDRGGTIMVTEPGVYKLAGTVYIGSNTSLQFGSGVFLKKVNEVGAYSSVLMNKGSKAKEYDEHITVEGLQIIVNGMDVRKFVEAYGLHGQLAFFYVKDLKIDHFRCLDLGTAQYGIQICTFEDIIINDVIIKGMKDGIHLGRGKRFRISNGVFETFDDAVALNAHDYAVGNPEIGWIEDGIVENCHDLNAEKTTGYFCRILAGAWKNWQEGMEVQQSDIVISHGRLYRVQMKPDGKKYISQTPPTHEKGMQVFDGITWGMVQNEVIYTCGVRNVTFRDIFLYKPRIGFSIHFDNDKFSRSYYPGAETPQQEHLIFDNIRVLHDKPVDFLQINTPVDVVLITNSCFQAGGISILGNKAMDDYRKTIIQINNCVFNSPGNVILLKNSVDNKKIIFKTVGSVETDPSFQAKVVSTSKDIVILSDLKGLNNK